MRKDSKPIKEIAGKLKVRILKQLSGNWFQLNPLDALIFQKAIAGEELSKVTNIHLGKASRNCDCSFCRIFRRKRKARPLIN